MGHQLILSLFLGALLILHYPSCEGYCITRDVYGDCLPAAVSATASTLEETMNTIHSLSNAGGSLGNSLSHLGDAAANGFGVLRSMLGYGRVNTYAVPVPANSEAASNYYAVVG